ncbi:MAG: hypothetical protein JSV89_07130 [Spirochaetaceae bacterium]|nr:MAG: hypothetical protein JSV89_07130 [Spirochaetaceae bacterium]
MRTTTIIPAVSLMILCFCPTRVACQDYGSWIRYSDRSDNALIVEMITEGDLSVGLEVASALGLRQDVRVQEIILAIGEMVDPRPQWERELILRTILAFVFPPDSEASELEARLQANREAIEFLVANLPQFSLSLKREVIRLLGFYHPPESLSVLMVEGRGLSDLLTLQRGNLNGEQAGLTLTYLDTIGRIGDPVFADIVLLLLERSRHIEVAEKARSVSRSLLLVE